MGTVILGAIQGHATLITATAASDQMWKEILAIVINSLMILETTNDFSFTVIGTTAHEVPSFAIQSKLDSLLN